MKKNKCTFKIVGEMLSLEVALNIGWNIESWCKKLQFTDCELFILFKLQLPHSQSRANNAYLHHRIICRIKFNNGCEELGICQKLYTSTPLFENIISSLLSISFLPSFPCPKYYTQGTILGSAVRTQRNAITSFN